MIVGETFVVDIHELSIDECMNLLALNLNIVSIEQIKDLIIVKKLIKVISEEQQIFGHHLIKDMIKKINGYCRAIYFSENDNEVLRQFKEFQRMYSRTCLGRKEILFTIFYAERAIKEIYYWRR